MRNAAMMDSTITQLKTIRPPKRSVSIPRGIRPRLPSRTGSATAMLFCKEPKCICLLRIGIIADMVPNTAKHKANAPVAKASCNLEDEVSCMKAFAMRYGYAKQQMLSSSHQTLLPGGCDLCHSKVSRNRSLDFPSCKPPDVT